MATSDYSAALKLGRRSYQAALTKGEYPYLPALDDILSYTEMSVPVNLGIMDIPLDKIVGTKTVGRTNAFANNFMPLLSESSEFGIKWSMVYEHQIEDGINDPIVAYEFMNQFYVQEGNKRVSVMKFLGTYSIPGSVIRLLPKRTDDRENRMYYEFVDFYEVSQSYDVYFTKEGSYKKLLTLMGKADDEAWDDEDKITFHSACISFAEAFKKAHGEKLDITVSDAFLVYLEIFGYDQVKNETETEMFQSLQKMWKEITLAEKGNQVELIQSPEEVKASFINNINKLIPGNILTPEALKIAFIYMKTTDTSSWAYAHELGRMHIEQVFGDKIETIALDRADTEEEVGKAIEQAVESGCHLIFTTASQMANQSVRSAILHPKVKIYNCSINISYSSIYTYYARMYESKFLMGAIAAALTRTDVLGYVADYPIYGTIANINAFALGARMINPYVKVYLEWLHMKGRDAREQLKQEGIVCISDSDMITPNSASRAYGLYQKNENGAYENLATPIWHWGKFYENIINAVLTGSTEADTQKGKKAINYWWGMSADVIDVICSKNMPHGTHRLIDFLKNSIRAGNFHPFDGLIYSQNGIIRCEEGSTLSPEDIIKMDWLAENVVGHIPELEELTEEAQKLVLLQGINADESSSEK